MRGVEALKTIWVTLHLSALGAIAVQGVFLRSLNRAKAAKRAVLRSLRILGLVMAIQALFFVYIRFVEPNWIVVSHLSIHDQALAQTLGSTKLLHITDLHIDRIGFRERRLIQLVNRQRPDWIVITGDLINHAQGWSAAREVIQQLNATNGIWVVPGNTDNHFLTPKQFDDGLQEIGIGVLRNESVPLNDTGAWLVGVDDPVNNRDRLADAMQDVPSTLQNNIPIILLAHAPDIAEDAVAAGISLVLVGHTHGGQIGIPWLIRLSSYANRGPYVMGGFYQIDSTKLYINRGIGTKIRPHRFLAWPEISVIEFKV